MRDKNLAQGWIDGGGYGSLHSRKGTDKSSRYHTSSQGTHYKGVKTWDPFKERWWVIQTYP